MTPRPSNWRLAEIPPRRLIGRLGVATLCVGVAGGASTAVLAVLLGASDVSLAARLLAVEVPIVLAGMIAQRLAAYPAPLGRRLVWAAVTGVVLIAAAQAWPEVGTFAGDVRHATVNGELSEYAARTGGQALAVSLLGALFGMMAATATLLLLAPTLMLMRAADARIGPRATTALATVVTLAVTTAFALPVTASVDAGLVTGVAAALAGAGAVVAAPWFLAPREA